MHAVLRIRYLFDPWIRDPGWVKNQDPDPGRIFWIISESLETISWVKTLKFLGMDPEIFLTLDLDRKIRIRDPR
jgi:hypothetical protein